MKTIFFAILSRLRARLQLKSDYFIYLLLTVSMILIINPHNLTYRFDDMDAIWNYQFARRILYDYIPYKDFMMLPLPFSAQINAWLLSIFGDKLMTMRWIVSSVAILNGLIAFLVLRRLGKGYIMAACYMAFFLCPFLLYPSNNYNWYVVLFLSLGLLFEIYKVTSQRSQHSGYELMIGISLGLLTITKQNIGLAAILASIIYLAYCSKNLGSKYFAKNLVFKMIGWFLVVGTEILYLAQTTGLILLFRNLAVSMYSFAGYARVPYTQLLNESAFVVLFAILVPSIILLSLFRGLFAADEFKKKTSLLVSMYALINFALVFPTSDWIHLIFGMPITALALATISNNPSTQDKERKILSLGLVIIILLSIVNIELQEPIAEEGPIIKHYESINMPLEFKTAIIDINDIIRSEEERGQTVYFLNYQASFYLIPTDKFYKYDDIISIDSIWEQEIIQLLSTSNNITVIIRSINKDKNWQETVAIEDFVRNNMKYVNIVHGFDIYTKGVQN